MRVARPDEMREADRLAIESRKIPGITLMESAGRGAAEAIRGCLEGATGAGVVIVAGKGNNGGDGFVVARYLREWGAGVRVFSAATDLDAYQGDARTNVDRLREQGEVVVPLDAGGERALGEALEHADVIVDALLGTGFTGSVRAPLDRVIGAIDAAPGFVVALDVPSGVDGSTGAVEGAAVRAGLTVTFGAPKSGLLFYPGRAHAGRILTIDIGIPEDVLDEAALSLDVSTSAEMRALLPRRAPDAHKGDAGRVLVVGGSVGMTGAPVLASRAALRVGAGLVTVAVPSSLNEILEVKLTEVMTLPCRETAARVFAEDAGREALAEAERADALAIGPGLSRARSAAAFAQEMALSVRVPAVLDADGLNAFEGQADALAEADGPRVLTPHPGEAARLLNDRVARVRKDPIAACRVLAETTRAVVLLKGAPTVLCDGRGAPAVRNVVINPTGNAGLATGGSGDVLTGIIAGLLAQGLDPFHAATLGAFLHGATGDIGADRLTQWGLVAGDLVDLLPEAMGLLDEGEDLAPWIA